MAMHYDHTKNKALAKLNPAARWQFLVNRNGTEHWQTLPLNRLPMWHKDVQYRIKPGQQYKDNTNADVLSIEKFNSAYTKAMKETTTTGTGIDHPHASDILEEIFFECESLDVDPAFFERARTCVRDDLSRREASRLVSSIAAAINKTR
jgi:hypothetical protein